MTSVNPRSAQPAKSVTYPPGCLDANGADRERGTLVACRPAEYKRGPSVHGTGADRGDILRMEGWTVRTLALGGVGLLWLGLCARAANAETAAASRSLGDLSGPWQLFVDDSLIEHRANVKRVYHPFRKHPGNPVLVADRPWEGASAYVYGTVLPTEDRSGYRMWYHSWADRAYRMLYATSKDGLAWTKPELGFVDYKGSKKNNILFYRTREDHSPQVIHTPWEQDPKRRYKLINFDYGRTPPDHTVTGYWGAYSPDGVRWTPVRRNPVLIDHPGDVGNFVWDPHTRRYLGYPKKFTTVRGFRRRCVGYTETTDFESWPRTRMMLIPDAYDDRWVKTSGQHTDFYGLCGFAYESAYLGFLWVFPITNGRNDGPIFVELVSSRDGLHWTRQDPPRTPILALGADGAWDDGMVFTTNHPLVEGDTIKLYYGGFDVTHSAGKATAGVGLATLRKDGFASLDADATTGTVTTRALQRVRGPLRVNYRASGGWVKVEVLDAAGKVVPGYGRGECIALTGDSVDAPVRWKTKALLPERDAPHRLRFILQQASLYSFAAGDSVEVLEPDGGVLYTFEGDRGTTATDKWTADRAQDAVFHNAVSVDNDASRAAFGNASLAIEGGDATWDTVEIPGTSDLGSAFTLAATVLYANTGFTRLFTSYRGGGPALDTELVFDFDPSGKAVAGLRAVIHAETVESMNGPPATDGKYHHFAMTYADGEVGLFFDGQEVGCGGVPGGPVVLADNLRFGEDLGGTVNEQLRGHADDVMVVRRALGADEIAVLAKKGADALPPRPPTTRPARPLLKVPDRVRRLGSRLELFVDDYLVDELKGSRLMLHHPRPAEIAVKFDKPWEGLHAGYSTVIKDDEVYRLYYRGLPISTRDGTDHEVTCYAESKDGICWIKPELELFDVKGTRKNNVILAGAKPCSHNFSPFVDTQPGVPPAQRYKALGGLPKSGLVAFVSADGVRWRKLRDKPVITRGAFDSQNVAFYSHSEERYVCYLRTWIEGVRWISRCTSKDFLRWTSPRPMDFGDAPREHLYTNQTRPYYRAPHLYIATAARFMPGRRVLTDAEVKQLGIDPKHWLKNDCSEVVLLTSRGGLHYDRTFLEAFVRPGPGISNWVSRTNYPALGVVPTGPGEMSMYVRRDNGQPSHHLRRYTMRVDGFASVHAPYRGGEMVTRPLTFEGKRLILNVATSAAGSVQVEIQDESGQPLPGYALADCIPIVGDRIEQIVSWKPGNEVGKLAERTVRLRFVMKDADLYSLRFR